MEDTRDATEQQDDNIVITYDGYKETELALVWETHPTHCFT